MCLCQFIAECSVKNARTAGKICLAFIIGLSAEAGKLSAGHGLPVYKPLTLLWFLTRMCSFSSSLLPWTTSTIWSLPSFFNLSPYFFPFPPFHPPPPALFCPLHSPPQSSIPPPSLSFLPLIPLHLPRFAALPGVRWLQTTDFLSHPRLYWIMQQSCKWIQCLAEGHAVLIREQDPLLLGWGQWRPYGCTFRLFGLQTKRSDMVKRKCSSDEIFHPSCCQEGA